MASARSLLPHSRARRCFSWAVFPQHSCHLCLSPCHFPTFAFAVAFLATSVAVFPLAVLKRLGAFIDVMSRAPTAPAYSIGRLHRVLLSAILFGGDGIIDSRFQNFVGIRRNGCRLGKWRWMVEFQLYPEWYYSSNNDHCYPKDNLE